MLSKPDEVGQRDNFMRITGLDMRPDGGVQGMRYKSGGTPHFEVHSVLPTLRVTPDGQIMKQLIISVTQRLRDIPVDENDPSQGAFDFPGGSTLIFDMDGKQPALRYEITRPIGDERAPKRSACTAACAPTWAPRCVRPMPRTRAPPTTNHSVSCIPIIEVPPCPHMLPRIRNRAAGRPSRNSSASSRRPASSRAPSR
ncbi:hypothetical protein LP420_34140 [Massilia sp. B-10]|nr:hypothetical protein LP420_34140 [Massilia sp. B-10]